jgi:hypothetical protein
MPELADVFRRWAEAYQALHGAVMPPSHRRAISDIATCRTAARGGHLWRCAACNQGSAGLAWMKVPPEIRWALCSGASCSIATGGGNTKGKGKKPTKTPNTVPQIAPRRNTSSERKARGENAPAPEATDAAVGGALSVSEFIDVMSRTQEIAGAWPRSARAAPLVCEGQDQPPPEPQLLNRP